MAGEQLVVCNGSPLSSRPIFSTIVQPRYRLSKPLNTWTILCLYGREEERAQISFPDEECTPNSRHQNIYLWVKTTADSPQEYLDWLKLLILYGLVMLFCHQETSLTREEGVPNTIEQGRPLS